MEGLATEEEAKTAGGGEGRSARRWKRWRGNWSEAVRKRYQGAQWPVGATPGRSPPRIRRQQERGAFMGREKGEGRGLPVSRKTCPAIPLEWETERGAQGLKSGGKPLGGLPGSGRGSRVAEGHRHPRSGRVAPGRRNLQSDPQGRLSYGGGQTGAGKGNNYPATQDTKARRDNSSSKDMASGTGPVAPQKPQQGKAEGGGSEVSPQRHSNSADSARTEHSVLACHKYGLLAP